MTCFFIFCNLRRWLKSPKQKHISSNKYFSLNVSSKDNNNNKKPGYVPKITTMFFVNQFNRLSCILGEIDRRHLNRVDNVTYTQFKNEVYKYKSKQKKKNTNFITNKSNGDFSSSKNERQKKTEKYFAWTALMYIIYNILIKSFFARLLAA